ncbi:uncharacterized protein [Periplaneta americana]|uniref:uncharacterized protein n=1 Tax=Periplaneta americana TaxID=6978 RepID=UPI0037E76A2E
MTFQCNFWFGIVCILLYVNKAVSTETEEEKRCKEKYKVDDDIFVKDGPIDHPHDAYDVTLKDESNADHRCYVQCLMVEFGYMNDGVVDLDSVINFVEKELKKANVDVDAVKLKADVASCTAKAGEGECMVGYHILKCLYNLTKDSIKV